MSAENPQVRKLGTKQFIIIGMAVLSVVFIWLGFTKYGFWDEFKGPRPGFFPVIIAIGMLAASLLALVFSFKESAPSWPKENWLVPLSVVAIMLATFVIGLLPSIAIYLVVWLRWLEKCSWKTTVIVFLITMAIVVGAFVLWLGVPFPKGLIYNALFY